MLNFLRKNKPDHAKLHNLYSAIMAQSLNPILYTDYKVADSFDGRYEMLIVHTCMVMYVLRIKDEMRAAKFNQDLFDETFRHMKISLREIGVGDVGIPKHMQKMMKSFNGRVRIYDEAIKNNDVDALRDAVTRNVYANVEGIDQASVEAFADYMQQQVKQLSAQDTEAIMAGHVFGE